MPRRPGLSLATLLLLCTTAQADLRRPAPLVLDLTAPDRVIALAAPESSGIGPVFARGRDRSPNLNLGTIIAQAAASTGVPEDFLLRLLRQESGLNPQAISVKGAQGIAQFMPATAAQMRLDDPFDPGQAIPKAAEMLRNLHGRYGNWGLAAAAYNAGLGRVDAWLLGRASLPNETVAYVIGITGTDVATWAGDKRSLAFGLTFPNALTSATLGYKTGSILSMSGPRVIDMEMLLPIAPARAALAHPARTSSRTSARARMVPQASTGPCAVLLDASSGCLAFTRY